MWKIFGLHLVKQIIVRARLQMLHPRLSAYVGDRVLALAGPREVVARLARVFPGEVHFEHVEDTLAFVGVALNGVYARAGVSMSKKKETIFHHGLEESAENVTYIGSCL